MFSIDTTSLLVLIAFLVGMLALSITFSPCPKCKRKIRLTSAGGWMPDMDTPPDDGFSIQYKGEMEARCLSCGHVETKEVKRRVSAHIH